MSLLAVGLSHRSAPLPVLERAALAAVAAERPGGLTERLLAAEHLADAVVLATCNRVEVYADTARFHGGVADIVRVLSEASGVDAGDLTEHLYVHYDAAVAGHLFSVTAGLDSMAVGESQILGQVRALWHDGRARGLGRLLDELFQQALRVGKRAQSETGLDRRSNVLVDHALERAAALLGTPAPRTLVVGAGAMAAVVVSSLLRRTGARPGDPAEGDADAAWLTVVNRSPDAARRLCANAGPGARSAPWEHLEAELAAAQLVVTCTGAVGHIVDGRHLAAVRPRRLVLVDLALPRDVDPLAARVDGVTLLDLETLGSEVTALVGADEVAAARQIIAGEVDTWRAQRAAGGVTPTVVALREQALAILEAELDRLDRRLPDLPDSSREEIRNTVRRALEKVLHTPTVRVKELADVPGGSFYAEALRTLFDLEVADSVAASDSLASVGP
ncbi:MAG: glutamyl-tRNA reductase [Kineosporiaceae bacterium]